MTLEQQTKEIDAEFSDAYNNGDMDALKTMHEDNAMMMAPTCPHTSAVEKL